MSVKNDVFFSDLYCTHVPQPLLHVCLFNFYVICYFILHVESGKRKRKH